MKNKKLLSILSVTLAAVILVSGVFAFFTAEVFDTEKAQVGSVGLEASAEIFHYQLDRDVMAMGGISSVASGAIGQATPEDVERWRQELRALFIEAPDNLNPGDNASADDEFRAGTDHEIVVTLNNTGSKSVETRVIVELAGVTAASESEDGTPIPSRPLTTNELYGLFVKFDPEITVSGVTSIHEGTYDQILERMEYVDVGKENTIAYGLDSYILSNMDVSVDNTYKEYSEQTSDVIKSCLLLSGIDTGKDNAEIEKYVAGEVYNEETGEDELVFAECPTSGSFKLDLGMYTDADPVLQDATITITVRVQAMQYRNTSYATWKNVYEEEFLFK